MGTGTAASVTEISCTCGYLEGSAADPNLPIRYNPEFNEYSFVWSSGPDEYGEAYIYHCPMCGGRAPESRRHEVFAEVPYSEYERLHALTSGLKSVDDAIRVLGDPSRVDEMEIPPGYAAPTDRSGNPVWPKRTLTFTEVSELADVQIAVKADNTIEVSCAPKYTGRRRAV